MPQFAANLTMMYPEMDLLERMRAAQEDGFAAVECLFPYAHEAPVWGQALRANGLVQALFNAPPGGFTPEQAQRAWDLGQRGTACLPGMEREFEAGVRLALAYAQVIGCRQIHVMAGAVPVTKAVTLPEREKSSAVELATSYRYQVPPELVPP